MAEDFGLSEAEGGASSDQVYGIGASPSRDDSIIDDLNILGTAIPEERATDEPDLASQPQQAPALSDDEHSGEMRAYTGVFEGPEKTLEIVFRREGGGDLCPEEGEDPDRREGLRRLSRSDLDYVCARVRCTILSQMSNRYLDAYVLSESSLFVYPHMLILKTCGTTTLLRCLADLIELGRRLGLELDWVGYSRKNFTFPGEQAYPHQSFHQELEYLYSHRNLCERLDGNGYTLGPVTSDHWFVFVADQTVRAKSQAFLDNDRVLNLMMFDIDEDVASTFYYDAYERRVREDETEEEAARRISSEQTRAAGIDALCPGAIVDPRAFEPCGYSMNAILFRSYYAMHVTPEAGSSYASFETNQRMTSYGSLIANVVRTFKPRRFVMTLMADELGLHELGENPLSGTARSAQIVVPPKPMVGGRVLGDSPRSPEGASKKGDVYRRTNLASIQVEDDCCLMMGTWVLHEEVDSDLPGRRPRGMSVS